MSTITKEFTKEQLTGIIEAVDDLNDELENDRKCHGMAGNKITEKWDYLNDRASPPEVVKRLARIALASLEAEPLAINDDMAYAFHHALSDSSLGADEVEEIKTGLRAAFANVTTPPAPVSVPETLPCPVLLEPGMRFGKGVRTKTMLDALERRAKYYAELEAMTPEQRAEHDAGMREFAAMLQGAEPVTTAYKLPANTPCKDAPEHIWLQTAGVWPENGEFSELTWCSDNQHTDDTLYVRADVAAGNFTVIPDGWVMLPAEPTQAMMNAWLSEVANWRGHAAGYRAMIAAAPQQEVK